MSSTSALALADPPVIQRLRLLFSQLLTFNKENSQNDKMSKISWLLEGVMDEILDELAEQDETRTGIYFAYFGKVVEWVGSGDASVLPDELREWLMKEQNIPDALWSLAESLRKEEAQKALPAGTADEREPDNASV